MIKFLLIFVCVYLCIHSFIGSYKDHSLFLFLVGIGLIFLTKYIYKRF